jgi:hypothetical protein
VSYYEAVFNRACASGAHSDLFDLHDPKGTFSYPDVDAKPVTAALAETMPNLPKTASLRFVSPRGNSQQIIAGFHAHGWPSGDLVGHATFDLENGRVVHLRLETPS